ncbi:MAG: hypothetical protein PHD10_01970 [Bacilli bacterium]|nr:hypothetical protein [Bacilli bacterium]
MNKRNIIGLTIIVLFSVFLTYFILNKESDSYVYIDINPSIQLEINDKQEVIDVLPLNEDANLLLTDLDVVGMKVEDATKTIVEEAIKTGYIDELGNENLVTITTTNDNKKMREKMKKKVNEYLEEKSILAQLEFKGFTDDMRAEADKYDVSYGKYLTMTKAIALNSKLTVEELATKKMQEIQNEIRVSLGKSDKTEIIERKRERINTTLEKRNKLKDKLYDEYVKEKNAGNNVIKDKQKLSEELLTKFKKNNRSRIQNND